MADAACASLALALAAPGPQSLVVTGGSTPGPAYDRLSRIDLGWSRITVTLSDDRWVEPASPLSNERLVRERLLTGPAAAAGFLPLKGAGGSPEADAAAVEPALRSLTPFAAVLLGMGEDGHIASLFQGAPDLPRALDPDGERLCVGVATAGLEPYVPRVSLTLAALLRTSRVLLLIGGEAKRALVERVTRDLDFAPPVAALLRQDRVPVHILWAA